MTWNDYGFLIPELAGTCDAKGKCMELCPFNIEPENEVIDEDALAKIYLQESKCYHEKIGHYCRLYAGYSKEFRLHSSSGGIATYLFSELLDKKAVSAIFSVRESGSADHLYDYAVLKSKDDIMATAKTKYYPVTLASVLSQIENIEGKIAIVGVGCFIKGIRLLQYYHPHLKDKIPFLIGIICGGLKSTFFTEYIASKAGVDKSDISNPQYRVKNLEGDAGDYYFRCNSNPKADMVKMRDLGDMWGTGMFKNNACDYCEDVTTELADISLGDAWIPPYSKDGRGNSIIITRTLLAEKIIQEGIKKEELSLDKLSTEDLIKSQRGGYNHKHKGLKTRMFLAKLAGRTVPVKRKIFEKSPLIFKFVQILRRNLRKQSLILWKKYPEFSKFNSKLHRHKKLLLFATKAYHKYNSLKTKA